MNSIPLNIMDAILSCDYPDMNKDYITSIFFDIFMEKKCIIYMTPRYNFKLSKYEKILVVRWIISVILQNISYDIPILIYIPRMFPEVPPEIFIEKKDEIGVNPQASYVDKNTLKVAVPLLITWNSSNSSIVNVLNQIRIEFSKFFPIFKLDASERGKHNYGENCVLKVENLKRVSFDSPSVMDKNRPRSPILKKLDLTNSNSINTSNISKDQNIFQHIDFYPRQSGPQNSSYSDDHIRNNLVNELAYKMIPKLKMEMCKLRADEAKMKIYEKDLSQQIVQLKSLTEKKDEILNRIKSLSTGFEDQILMMKYYIEANSCKDINKDKIENFVKISNPEKLKLITLEAVSEDYMFHIKKAYEKKIFTFPDTIKMIRSHSRELFSIKYVKDKNKEK